MSFFHEDEDFRLDQKKLFFSEQTYIISGDKLKYHGKGISHSDEFHVNLKELESQPARYRSFPIGWFLLAAILIPLTISVFISLFTLKEKVEILPHLIIIFVFLSFNSFVIRKIYQNWLNIWQFSGSGNSLPIWANKPNKKEAEQFVKKLSARIEKYNDEYNREKAFLEYLNNQGLINEWNYEKALKLLEHNDI